nr:hypothetical protein CKG001_02180 [Bdellovibrio sp. CKG001]
MLALEGIMREEVEVSIYKLKNGGYQASYLNPFSKKRIRNKFKMLNEANDFKLKIHAQFITDVMTGYSHLPTKQFLDAYLKLNPEAKMVSRGLPFYNSFVETFGQIAVIRQSAIARKCMSVDLLRDS